MLIINKEFKLLNYLLNVRFNETCPFPIGVANGPTKEFNFTKTAYFRQDTLVSKLKSENQNEGKPLSNQMEYLKRLAHRMAVVTSVYSISREGRNV